ncbi:hypothetical protein AUK40_01610 [Candidatus Wirthbacteria bacterium CG2_30_54_11]|uniref:Plasmid stabilization protein n=1 Tax=Candidatus Wirthbacteria bacterium CG2_30_54_11 TaxID=1817892 RepID=A0A1J5J4H0_9BACT|nr:MAG: hypothetical protein AUK40_01610 [Candidatus Wirthbacteria bacterium CG2_30_54_11]
MPRLLIKPKAQKQIARLGNRIIEKILSALARLEADPGDPSLDITQLRGKKLPGFRLRIGDYRLLYTIEDGTIEIYLCGHRKDVYKIS